MAGFLPPSKHSVFCRFRGIGFAARNRTGAAENFGRPIAVGCVVMAQPTTNPTTEASPKPKSNMLLFLLVGLALLLGGSGATWFFFLHGKPAQAAAEKTPKPEKTDPEFTLHLDSFTVNLDDQEESHFLRITLELGLGHAPKGDPGKEGDNSGFPTAQTRDALLTVLSACKANELLTPEGKTALKQHLLAALQQKVPEIDARDVYFTEFLVQR
jgi:flagellar basal body-associated protein FliL